MMGYDARQEAADYEFNARYDYVREAYGDPCPRHPGVLRGGADCWKCENEMNALEQMMDQLDSVAGEAGEMTVTRAERKDVIQRLQARGWKVRCVGQRVIWGAK